MLFQSCCEVGSLSVIDLCNSDITALLNYSTGGYRGVIEGRGGEGRGGEKRVSGENVRGGEETREREGRAGRGEEGKMNQAEGEERQTAGETVIHYT